MLVLQLFLMAAAPLIAAYDLYLPTHEVSSLLGLSRELYYVSAGVVRKSALQFNIPISDNVNKLHFVWRSPDENVRYDIKISSNDSDALRQPHLNGNWSSIFLQLCFICQGKAAFSSTEYLCSVPLWRDSIGGLNMARDAAMHEEEDCRCSGHHRHKNTEV